MPRQTKPTDRRAAARRGRSTCSRRTAAGDRRRAGMVRPAGGEQAALIGLMTRLILEHVDKNRSGSTTGAGHDL